MPSIKKYPVSMYEYMQKPNTCALAFIIAGSIWFMTGTIYGSFTAIHLMAPNLFQNIPFLVFGRVRPAHVNTVLFGFVTTTLVGGGLYYVPALLRTRLWSEPLGWLSFLLWNVTVLSGPISFGFGRSQGREYTEYLWIFDVIFTLAILGLLVNVIMTILQRQERTLYVSVWYFTGTFLWTAGTYPIGNVMWHPKTGALPGIMDSIFLWYWGHNLPGLLLTPLATAPLFFVIPRLTKTRLYSHILALISFWTLVALYTHIGGHHILQAPIPNWLKVMSVIDSLAMVVPVFTVLINIWMSMRGVAGRVWKDHAGMLVMTGTIWYLITCIQGPFQSIPAIQRVTHFNNWTIGHSHIAVLGFAGFIALGTMWHVLPDITRRRLYSTRLVFLQFGLLTFGLTGFFVVLTIAGLIQGEAWNNGETVYRTIPMIMPYMVTRAMMGTFIVFASFVGFYNLMMTLLRGQPFDPALEEEGA